MKQKKEFLEHLGQTTEHPLLLEVESAEGIYIKDKNVFLRIKNTEKHIFTISTSLPGLHNKLNCMLAGTIAYLDKKNTKEINNMIKKYSVGI